MFAALLDPRSIQWLLTLGGGLMVLGGLVWLISKGVLENPLVLAVVLGVMLARLAGMVRGLFVRVGLMMLGCFAMMLGGMLVMFSRSVVMLDDLVLGHGDLRVGTLPPLRGGARRP